MKLSCFFGRKYFSGRAWRTALTLVALIGCVAFADEWKARHPLVSSTGIMTLSEPPAPEDIFFSGPSGDLDGWLAGLKSWRADRITRTRYEGSQYDRPELAWTQKILSQV